MDAGVLHLPAVLRFPACTLRRLGNFAVSWKELAAERSWFAPQKGVSWLSSSCIISDADTRGQARWRIFALARSDKRDENERSQFFNGNKSKSSDKEEIIALLKRIQSEISKRDSQSTNERSSKPDQHGLPEPILDVLHNKAGKQARGKSTTGERNKTLTKKGASKKDQEVLEQPKGTNCQLTRLPSNFVKKSPIPSLTTPRGQVPELNNETSPVVTENKQVLSQGLEEMKIAELRAVAKSRGIKGYSKKKKGELIEILRS